MIQLEVIQGAVARLLERIDDIVHKGWDKDRGMACLAIDEIRDTVRLIDMGLHPLFKELFDTVIKSESEVQALLYFAQFLSAWNLFAAEVKCFPVSSLISAATSSPISGCVLIPVPFVIKINIYVKVTQKIRCILIGLYIKISKDELNK
ncbi:hypothetical protein [Lysinibacillus xylanilyticus]|uniref:hypothetical protein n=1 Tax=Lysinibacillus xylanilyticus TaxID=582475 RepID=UPI003CFCA435